MCSWVQYYVYDVCGCRCVNALHVAVNIMQELQFSTFICKQDKITSESKAVHQRMYIQWCSYNLELDLMTLILDFDPDVLKMYLLTKDQVSRSKYSKVIRARTGHTDIGLLSATVALSFFVLDSNDLFGYVIRSNCSKRTVYDRQGRRASARGRRKKKYLNSLGICWLKNITLLELIKRPKALEEYDRRRCRRRHGILKLKSLASN